MTRDERDELVELLKCAADIAANGDRDAALGCAAFHLDRVIVSGLRDITGDGHWVSLLRGKGPVHDVESESHRICGDGYEWCLLEAAARVENEEWP